MSGPAEQPYAADEAFMLRCCALPVERLAELHQACEGSDPADPEGARRATYAVLRGFAADESVRAALRLAASDLLDALPRLDRDPLGADKKTRRVYASLQKYLTRMTTRATPYGGFAGVAVGHLGTGTTATLGDPPIIGEWLRVDRGWLDALIDDLEQDPAIAAQLDVVADCSVQIVGGYAVLSSPQRLPDDADTATPDTEEAAGPKPAAAKADAVRIRATAPARLALELARHPVPRSRLVSDLCAAFPDARHEQVDSLVLQLWNYGYLRSDLRPPPSEPAPARYLWHRLARLDGAADTSAVLRDIVDLVEDDARPGADRLHDIEALQRKLGQAPDRGGAMVVARLDAPGLTLPREVGEAAAEAANCLLRLGQAFPGPARRHTDFQGRFLERYGMGSLVPVLEVLDPVGGLGVPEHYRGRSAPPQEGAVPEGQQRILCELWTSAWAAGHDEVELTDELIDRLVAAGEGADHKRRPPRPRMDLIAEIHAESRPALDDGTWRLAVRSLADGVICHRFLPALGKDVTREFLDAEQRQSDGRPDVIAAEVSFPPPNARMANIMVGPPMRPFELCYNTTPAVPADRVLSWDEVLVGTTGNRLFLWSKRFDREIRVSQAHALNPTAAPHPCRFVLDVSAGAYAGAAMFHWGQLSAAPFLPRIVRGRTILAPARWQLDGPMLDAAADGPPAAFPEAVGDWRRRWRVPRFVLHGTADNVLPWDLDNPITQAEFRTAAKSREQAEKLVFSEYPGIERAAWCTGRDGGHYMSEVVFPLTARAPVPADTDPPPTRLAGPVSAVLGANRPPREWLPGDRWTQLNLYLPDPRQEDVISQRLLPLVTELRAEGLIDRWFFIRYRDDTGPHLRLRLRTRQPQADEDRCGQTLARALVWGRSLITAGLAADMSVVGYRPEVDRYGGPEVFDSIERVFEANSEFCAEALSVIRELGLEPEVVTAAAADLLCAHWGLPPAARLDLLPDQRRASGAREQFARHRGLLCDLLFPWPEHPAAEESRTVRARLTALLATGQPAIAAAGAAVRHAAASGTLVGEPEAVLQSLLHMQANRILGIDRAQENRSYGIWQSVMHTVRGRPDSPLSDFPPIRPKESRRKNGE